MATNFTLSEQEEKDAKEWIEEHKRTCPYSFKNGNLPALGEHYYYKFIPNGLGHCVEIGCIYCKQGKNITDYNW